MRKALWLVGLALLGPLPAFAQDAGRCVQVYDMERGKSCNSRTSFSFRLRNQCNQAIDMKYCMERRDGRWSCGMWTNTRPGGSTSWYICDASGRYQTWARVHGSNMRFPRDPD